jgi:seryl-tRNA synthetase
MELDATWRSLTMRTGTLRSATKSKARPTPAELERLAGIKTELQELEAELASCTQRRAALLDEVPNPPDPSAPDGTSDEDAVEVRRVGEPPSFSFSVRSHAELAGFDHDRAVRLSGSRFVYRFGPVALVELSLYRYALEVTARFGFVPVLPPVLVREPAMYGTGFLPTDEVNLYRVERDDLYLTGTSEVALAAIHSDEILDVEELPRRYAGYSTCFRREAGAAGRDTKGILRLHQFDKVEMFSFVEPSKSAAEHERILSIEEEIATGLGLCYRVVNTAAGDLGPSAAKKFDLEAYLPSEGRYREITSCSNTTDYQARRLKIRYRDRGGALRSPHTLNGTAMTARFLAALAEQHQQADGTVPVPEVLQRLGAPVMIETAERAPA